MIGFSAGGLVTSEALFGPAETRPDFAALIYGVGQIKEAPRPAPPLFLAVAADDTLAVGRTVEQFTAYRKGKGPAELHVFQMGGHGFLTKGGGADHFMDRLEEWLGANKLLSRSAPAGKTGRPGEAREGGQPPSLLPRELAVALRRHAKVLARRAGTPTCALGQVVRPTNDDQGERASSQGGSTC
jgi:hypothetical protein